MLSPRKVDKANKHALRAGPAGKPNKQDVLPVKFMVGALIVFLSACILTSVMYLRAANREMLWLVNMVHSQDAALTSLEGRFKRAHAAEEALGELKSKYTILQTEVSGLRVDRDRLVGEVEKLKGAADAAASNAAALVQQAQQQAQTVQAQAQHANVQAGEVQRVLQEQVAQLERDKGLLATQLSQAQANEAAGSGQAAAAAAEVQSLRLQLADALRGSQQQAGVLTRVSQQLGQLAGKQDLNQGDVAAVLAVVTADRAALEGRGAGLAAAAGQP